MIKAGSARSPFLPQIVSGDRTLLTHPCSSDRKINSGEIVVIHLGATYRGYCAKMCRAVALRQIPKEQEQVYEVLLEAQQLAIDELKPGVTVSVVVALFIGFVEVAQVLSSKVGLNGWVWNWVQNLDLKRFGYLLAFLFVLMWAVSFGLWKFLDLEEQRT